MPFGFIPYLLLFTLLAACQHPSTVSTQRQEELQQQALLIIQQFTHTLKPQLKQALQNGDPAKAIQVCSTVAPKLTQQLSQQTGWNIKRVSLKARNHHTALPDHWEKSMLLQFNQQQAKGISPMEMTASRMDKGHYRFMKAQAVAPVCLLCHGKNISPEITKALTKYYPQDQATGYTLGQIRGAFSLSKQL